MARGLIFDCDGVLVDSEPHAAAELQAMFAAAGAPIGLPRIYEEFLGRSAQIVADALTREGQDAGPAMAGFTQNLAARFRTELRPVPGMADAIAGLDGPRAVASSSAPERLALSLAVTGIAPLFGNHVYSAAQVARGKPAPDLFLMAADRIGVAPADCIVIEDSPAGIHAAQAAGMRVIGFLGGGHAEPAGLASRLAALGPDALIAHADELADSLARLG